VHGLHIKPLSFSLTSVPFHFCAYRCDCRHIFSASGRLVNKSKPKAGRDERPPIQQPTGDRELSQVPPDDSAAAAFEALREEVALVRRAVCGLAAERATTTIPYYSQTLANILQAVAANRFEASHGEDLTKILSTNSNGPTLSDW
jgi:hypothetical protein